MHTCCFYRLKFFSLRPMTNLPSSCARPKKTWPARQPIWKICSEYFTISLIEQPLFRKKNWEPYFSAETMKFLPRWKGMFGKNYAKAAILMGF